jgi:hypothetical protein
LKGKLVFLIILLPALCFAGEPEVFTDTDLQKYGSSDIGRPSDSNYCSVVGYNSYAQIRDRPIYTDLYGNISGGGTSEGPTYLIVKIKNNSTQNRIIYTPRDIKVHTIKGNVISPKNSETYEIRPGEIITINGLNLGRVGIKD